MSSWRVDQHYGFGAAQIPIRPEPHSSEMLGLMEGAVYLAGELVAGGPVATMRRLVGQTPAILLGLLLFAAFIVTLAQDRTDQSPIEIVLFDTAETIPEPVPEEVLIPPPLPAPVEIAKLPPPKVVAPKLPPPPQLAEKPKPPPPPTIARPKPKPALRPKPVIPQIAKIETPRISQQQRVERAVRERPDLVARPRVAIDVSKPVLAAESPRPRMDRVARASVDRSISPRLMPGLAAPAEPKAELPQRSFRVASAKPVAGQRPRALPGLAPAPGPREPAPVLPDRSMRRTAGPRPATSPSARRIAPSLDRAPVPAAPAMAVTEPRRSTRPSPRPTTRRVAHPAASIGRATTASAVSPTRASRSGRATPMVSRGTSGDRPGVAGVPLGDLAACLSDREEDRLKQAVVAAVTTQEECVSKKGTYRFIETKNLNAFLMWIDRAPARAVSDRCVELGFALECLESASRRAAR